TSAPVVYHELPAPGFIVRQPILRSPVEGPVADVRENERGDHNIIIGGQTFEVTKEFQLSVAKGQNLNAGDPVASSDAVWLAVRYRNTDRPGVIVVFPPEGVELLYATRTFEQNLLAAFGVLFGRLLFVAAIGLALSTFLDGKVAALATVFVLVVAA